LYTSTSSAVKLKKNPQSFTTIGVSNTNAAHSRKRRIDTTTTALHTNNQYLDDEASYAFFQPRTESSLSTPPLPSDHDDKSSVVRKWLLFHLPKLKPQDVEVYTKVLMGDGFDSEEMLLEVREEDLDFMKVVSWS
jgi:hypothetical protein